MPKELIFSLTCLFLRCTHYAITQSLPNNRARESRTVFPKIIGKRLKLEKVYIKSEDTFKKKINNA